MCSGTVVGSFKIDLKTVYDAPGILFIHGILLAASVVFWGRVMFPYFVVSMGYIIFFCILFINTAWKLLTAAGYICVFIKEFSV
jgi:hypothetical protein